MSDIFQQKISVTPEEVLQVIAQEYILPAAMDAQPGLVIADEMLPYYRAKSVLYRIAIALMVMLNEEKENPNLLEVRVRIENAFFMSQDDGKDLRAEVGQAIQQLGESLFSEEQREFAWGISWFKEIGIDETDPINLAMFAMKWMNQYTLVTKTIRDFVIEVPIE